MGSKDEKLVMRVTIRAQEYPDCFRELGAMTAPKRRGPPLHPPYTLRTPGRHAARAAA